MGQKVVTYVTLIGVVYMYELDNQTPVHVFEQLGFFLSIYKWSTMPDCPTTGRVQSNLEQQTMVPMDGSHQRDPSVLNAHKYFGPNVTGSHKGDPSANAHKILWHLLRDRRLSSCHWTVRENTHARDPRPERCASKTNVGATRRSSPQLARSWSPAKRSRWKWSWWPPNLRRRGKCHTGSDTRWWGMTVRWQMWTTCWWTLWYFGQPTASPTGKSRLARASQEDPMTMQMRRRRCTRSPQLLLLHFLIDLYFLRI